MANFLLTLTQGGKKVTAAVTNTGKAVAGGLGAAKGALSSWWGGFNKTDKSATNTEDQISKSPNNSEDQSSTKDDSKSDSNG